MRMATTNLDYATGPTADGRHLRQLVLRLLVDVLFVQEAKNLRGRHSVQRLLDRIVAKAARTLTPIHYASSQRTNTEARAGSALAWSSQVRVKGRGLFLGGTSGETLARWIARGTVRLPSKAGALRTVELFSAHVFPARTGRAAQLRYLRALARRLKAAERRGHEWIVGTDANMSLEAVVAFLETQGIHGARHYGEGIVGFVVSPGVVVRDHGVNRYGKTHGLTDHPVPWIDVERVA